MTDNSRQGSTCGCIAFTILGFVVGLSLLTVGIFFYGSYQGSPEGGSPPSARPPTVESPTP